MTFTEWLLNHKGDDGSIGDLARDVANDTEWPSSAITLGEYESYLISLGASGNALDALRSAWSRFEDRG